MAKTRFVQIHTLQSHPAALVNRDDTGLAKKISFGGFPRTRISSQSLKRRWRTADDRFSLRNIPGVLSAIRSRNTIKLQVIEPLKQENAATEPVLNALEEAFNIGVYGEKGTSQAARPPLLLGLAEVNYLQQKAAQICDQHPEDAKAAENAAQLLFASQERENFQAFRAATVMPAGIEGAMYGRMVASDIRANIEAAVHVAHSFTVHRSEHESDFFSVVDDLQLQNEHAGSAHIGEVELTSGLFYGYVVIDLPCLISNIEARPASQWETADRELTAQIVGNFVRLISHAPPTAKRGSTAPYSYCRFMLVEAGEDQPYSLAEAFREPVKAQTGAAIAAIAEEISRMDSVYAMETARRYMSVIDDATIPAAARLNMPQLAQWAADAVRNGEA